LSLIALQEEQYNVIKAATVALLIEIMQFTELRTKTWEPEIKRGEAKRS